MIKILEKADRLIDICPSIRCCSFFQIPEKESITKIVLQKQRYSVLPIFRVLGTLENIKQSGVKTVSKHQVVQEETPIDAWYEDVR